MTAAVAPQTRQKTVAEEIAEIDRVVRASVETTDARKRLTPFLTQGQTYDRIAAQVREEMIKTPLLAKCTEESITAAVVKIQRWRLEIGETAYLVPFKDTRNDRWVCTPVRSYLGDIQILMDNGVARRVDARCVYKNEHFEREEGLNPKLEHRPLAPSERGPMIGAYAIVWMTWTNTKHEFVFLEDIDAVRQRHSMQWKNGACPDWWAMKRAIKVTTKLLPKTANLKKALAQLEDEDEMDHSGAVASTRSAIASIESHRERPAMVTADGEDLGEEEERHDDAPPPPPVMRFGKTKGTPLANLELRELKSARKWAADTDEQKFGAAIFEMDAEIRRREASRANTQGTIPGLDDEGRKGTDALAAG